MAFAEVLYAPVYRLEYLLTLRDPIRTGCRNEYDRARYPFVGVAEPCQRCVVLLRGQYRRSP